MLLGRVHRPPNFCSTGRGTNLSTRPSTARADHSRQQQGGPESPRRTAAPRVRPRPPASTRRPRARSHAPRIQLTYKLLPSRRQQRSRQGTGHRAHARSARGAPLHPRHGSATPRGPASCGGHLPAQPGRRSLGKLSTSPTGSPTPHDGRRPPAERLCEH